MAAVAAGVLAACGAAAAGTAGAPGSVLATINSIRARGCAGTPGAPTPLREQARLDGAARQLAAGQPLGAATASVGYRTLRSMSLHISGDLADTAVARTLATRFCAQLANPALRGIGFYRHGSDLWVIAAAPFATPALSDPAAVARQVLRLVNEARAAGHRCGNREFGPAPPLRPSARLRKAALAHARDMAAHGYFRHIGRDGSTPGQRVARARYPWSAVGENIAAGPTSAREAAEGWLASPGHCANIMDPQFTQTAVAYAIAPKSRAGVYWTEEFAAPLRHTRRETRAPSVRAGPHL